MKISNSTPNYINQTYANQTGKAANQNLKSEKPADETFKDSINLSGRTKDLQKIAKALETESQDREKLVADLKEKVQTNQYNVNAEAVAEKMAGILMNDIG